MKNNKTRHSKTNKQYYMYGQHAIIAAAQNKKRTIKQIYCLQKQSESLQKLLPEFTIEIIDKESINKKIGYDLPHQGMIALVDSVFKSNIEDFEFNTQKDRIVILDQISDPQNIGAIIRSAAAFGIDKLILPADNSPDENATIAKAACGCLELVQIAKVPNIKNSMDKLKKMGYWIVGLDGSGKNQIDEILSIEKLAIIIGSEGKGMRQLTKQNCDFLVSIPISKQVESLNASNAASIMFYSLRVL